MIITSRSNGQYKKIKKLLSSQKARNEAGLFAAEGERIAKEAPKELIELVCVCESYAKKKSPSGGMLIFSDELFRSLSDTVNPQGIMVIARQPGYSLDEIIERNKERALYLMLDDISDPGNLGTMIRTAEAAGVSGVVLSLGCADIFNPKVIRSTMGSIFRVPFVREDICRAAGRLKKEGTDVYAAALDADKNYNEINYGYKNAFIIGNEARGISKEAAQCAGGKIKIPMAGEVESLNAAISAAIVLYGVK